MLKACIEDQCSKNVDDKNIAINNSKERNVHLKMSIADAEDSVWTSHRNYLSAFKAAK